MPYTINRYNNQQVTVVSDGTIDSTLDIKLIGKNYAGYGEVQNENMVFMLENFSNISPPPRPLSGQLWYDSGTSKLKFYDSQKWRTTGGAEIGATAPTGLTVGDFWFDTNNKQLFAWDGGAFILVGPQGVEGSDTTQMRSRSVTDTLGDTHAVIEAVANGDTIFIVSPDAEFTLDTATSAITGFTKIQQGITLCYSNTDVRPGETTSNHRFWGTATNSERLGGFSADSFVKSNSAAFSTLVSFSDLGYTVGANPRLRVFNDGAQYPTFQNMLNDTIVFQTTVNSSLKTPLKLVGNDILPGSNNISNIGSSSFTYNTVYADVFEGKATKANTLKVGTEYYSASVGEADLGPANTIAVRDASGNLNATLFQGVATTARYADLAEKYLADAEYEKGTVVCVGGEKEVTASTWGSRAIGAVSTNPAYMMNSDLEGGTYIALKGRVPVKVIGSIKKGDQLIAANDGCAMMAVPHASGVFAVALESSDDTGIKLVECLIL
jgi:hypothetical protein